MLQGKALLTGFDQGKLWVLEWLGIKRQKWGKNGKTKGAPTGTPFIYRDKKRFYSFTTGTVCTLPARSTLSQ